MQGAALPDVQFVVELLEPVLEVLDLFQLSGHVVQHHAFVLALELHG